LRTSGRLRMTVETGPFFSIRTAGEFAVIEIPLFPSL
jgi:hypothetical protein